MNSVLKSYRHTWPNSLFRIAFDDIRYCKTENSRRYPIKMKLHDPNTWNIRIDV